MPTKEEIDHQQELLSLHRRTLAHYLRQEALSGEAFTPPAVSNGISDERNEIRIIKQTLRGWNVAVEDYPDEAPSPETLAPPPRSPAARPALWIGLGLAGLLLIGVIFWQNRGPATVAITPTAIPATAAPTAMPAPAFTLRYPLNVAGIEQIELVADPALANSIPITDFLQLTRLEFGVIEAQNATAWNVRLMLSNTSTEPIVLDLSRRFFKLSDDQGQEAELIYFCCDSRPGELLEPGRQREIQLMFRSVDGWYGKETTVGSIYLQVQGLRPVVRAVWRIQSLATAE
jgi:hypothetical protein